MIIFVASKVNAKTGYMNFIEELKWRGLYKEATAGLEEVANQDKIVGYIGYDPTAASLTIGNMVTIMLLKHFQLHGHRPIVLMGGATGKIGDPSGKDTERQLLSYDIIDENIEKFKKQFAKFLDFDGENAAIILNNEHFYQDMDVFSFLRNVGKNITVNYMMAKDSVKNRINNREQGLSFTEFSYQIIQGYDFQYLQEHHQCSLQMGGSDQWGNITTGTHFVGKNGAKAYGLTCPLLTKSDGSKFGKSEQGNVWLDETMTSPFQFYQFWLNKISDDDIEKMFKIFSLKSKQTIEALLEEHLEESPRILLQMLAEELTTRVHGKAALEGVQKATAIVFNKKLKYDLLQDLSAADFDILKSELPCFYIDNELLDKGIQLDDLLVKSHSSLDSKGKIRNAIKGNALSINTQKPSSHSQQIDRSFLINNQVIYFQNGKKNKFLGIPLQLKADEKKALIDLDQLQLKTAKGEESEQQNLAFGQWAKKYETVLANLIETGYVSSNLPAQLSHKGQLLCKLISR